MKRMYNKNLKKVIIALPVFILAVGVLWHVNKQDTRVEYEEFLENHSFNKRGSISSADLKKIPKQDRPDLAWEQDFLMTMDPKLKRPVKERLLTVYDEVRRHKMLKTGIPGDINNSWIERGPNNVGGRVRALMFDPNDTEYKKVWAGSVSGGLWYTDDITNEDAKWHSVNDFWQNLAITCIAYDPSSTKTYYVGTGEGWGSSNTIRGLGIWKTTDAGNTWEHLKNTVSDDFSRMQKLIVTSEGKVIAATSKGLFLSIDKGKSWIKKESGYFADLEIASDKTIFAAKGGGGNQGGIYISKDKGETWKDISPSGDYRRVEISVAPSDSKIIYAVAAGSSKIAWFKKSTNAGDTWKDVKIPMYLTQSCEKSTKDFTRGQHWYDLITAVHPTNPNLVLAGGIDIHKSIDGGKTWKGISYWTGACAAYVHADQHAMVFRPEHPNEVIFGCDGGVHYSNNIDAINPKFIDRNKDINITQYYACAIHPDANKDYYIAGAQDNGSHKLTQAGLGKGKGISGGDGAFCFIDQKDPAIQISSYTYSTYYISRNGGLSFGSLRSSDDGSFINPTAYDSNLGILYSSKSKYAISKITNIKSSPEVGEINIKLKSRTGTLTVSPYTTETSTLFVGTRAGRVFKIKNAEGDAPTINEIGSDKFPEGNVSCIELGANEDEIIATFSNYGVKSVWYTKDGGKAWVSKEGDLADMPIRWALFNPNDRNQVILATEVGVWATKDFNAEQPTWTASSSGLANVRVDMLKIRESDMQVLAATYGRGLFTSNAFSKYNENDLVAYFSTKGSKTVGLGGSTRFEDLSTGEPESWAWTFEGGEPASSTEQNPKVKYNAPGTYKVSLTVKKGNSTNTKTKESYVKVLSEAGWIEQATSFPESSIGVEFIDVVDANIVWALATKNKLFTRTTNSGDTWTSGEINIEGKVGIAMISAVDENIAWIPVYARNTESSGGIFKTIDGGATWTKQNTALFEGSAAFPNVVHFWDKNTGFCMGDPNDGYFEIYTTTDGGDKWTRVKSSKIPEPLTGEAGTVGFYSVAEDGTAFFNTNKGRIFKSTDKGNSWTVIKTKFSGGNKCAFADKDNGVVINVGEASGMTSAYLTSDGGETWNPIFSKNVYLSNIEYVPGTKKMYITAGGSSSKAGVSYSVDGGKNWNSFTIQEGKPCLSIGFADMTTGWAGKYSISSVEGGIEKYAGSKTLPDFIYSPKKIKTKAKTTFTDNTFSKESGLTYKWDFGEDATPATADTKGPHEVTYSKIGNKKATLTVKGITISKKFSVSEATGVEDIENTDNMFKIYPNPSSDEVKIHFKSNKNSNNRYIHIYRVNGQQVYSNKVQQAETNIHLAKYGKGIYFVRIIDEGKSNTHKIIIK